jgi:hypothetical protein
MRPLAQRSFEGTAELTLEAHTPGRPANWVRSLHCEAVKVPAITRRENAVEAPTHRPRYHRKLWIPAEDVSRVEVTRDRPSGSKPE